MTKNTQIDRQFLIWTSLQIIYVQCVMCRIAMKHPTYKTAICKTGNRMAIFKRMEKMGGCDATNFSLIFSFYIESLWLISGT